VRPPRRFYRTSLELDGGLVGFGVGFGFGFGVGVGFGVGFGFGFGFGFGVGFGFGFGFGFGVGVGVGVGVVDCFDELHTLDSLAEVGACCSSHSSRASCDTAYPPVWGYSDEEQRY